MGLKYTFYPEGPESHGWLLVFDEKGNLLAPPKEEWHIVPDYEIKRMENHECRPGQMIPPSDPRWYTHCQDCGKIIKDMRKSYIDHGQHHQQCPKYRGGK